MNLARECMPIVFKLKREIVLYTLLMLLNLTFALQPQPHSSSTLHVDKQWKLLSYNFLPHAPIKDENFYNPMNILITGLAVSYDRLFIATPKLFSGVSSTLSFVPKSDYGDSPVLQAYPDWSYSTTGRSDFNCSDMILVSVYRLRIDSCNRLWVLDAGITASLEDFEKTCPPKILVIDLNTDQVVRRIDFPPEILRGESLFTNLVIDETTASAANHCDDVFVYISDTVEPGIIVYDSGKDVTWRVAHPSMYPDPDFAESKILNDRFVLMDGIVGLTFDDKSGTVYFQPLATDRIFSIHKDVLRAGPVALTQVLDVKLVGKKSSQGIGLTISPIDSSLVFAPMTETAIAAWNPHTNKQTVLAQDQDQLQFIADMTTSPHDPAVIFAISSKFHRFYLKNLNPDEVNNRIMKVELSTTAHHYVGYPLKQGQFGHGYYTNYLDKPNRPPYKYDTSGLANYRQPFKLVNPEETIHSNSFLDSLAESPPKSPSVYSTWQPIVHDHGYYYKRAYRSAKPDQALHTAISS